MYVYILLGESAVIYFNNEDWAKLEELILENNGGDIVAWNKENDCVNTLLDMLKGWNDFIELSALDLKNIEANTKIEINRN